MRELQTFGKTDHLEVLGIDWDDIVLLDADNDVALATMISDHGADEMVFSSGIDVSKGIAIVEGQQLTSLHVIAENCPARTIGPVNLKRILRLIEPKSQFPTYFPPKWIFANPPWHTDTTGRRLHHQRHMSRRPITSEHEHISMRHILEIIQDFNALLWYCARPVRADIQKQGSTPVLHQFGKVE